ncbi:UNVERIFIED_CONTAM: hypothetical protein NCL1_41283 [Trichonephila clavipes]
MFLISFSRVLMDCSQPLSDAQQDLSTCRLLINKDLMHSALNTAPPMKVVPALNQPPTRNGAIPETTASQCGDKIPHITFELTFTFTVLDSHMV